MTSREQKNKWRTPSEKNEQSVFTARDRSFYLKTFRTEQQWTANGSGWMNRGEWMRFWKETKKLLQCIILAHLMIAIFLSANEHQKENTTEKGETQKREYQMAQMHTLATRNSQRHFEWRINTANWPTWRRACDGVSTVFLQCIGAGGIVCAEAERTTDAHEQEVSTPCNGDTEKRQRHRRETYGQLSKREGNGCLLWIYKWKRKHWLTTSREKKKKASDDRDREKQNRQTTSVLLKPHKTERMERREEKAIWKEQEYILIASEGHKQATEMRQKHMHCGQMIPNATGPATNDWTMREFEMICALFLAPKKGTTPNSHQYCTNQQTPSWPRVTGTRAIEESTSPLRWSWRRNSSRWLKHVFQHHFLSMVARIKNASESRVSVWRGGYRHARRHTMDTMCNSTAHAWGGSGGWMHNEAGWALRLRVNGTSMGELKTKKKNWKQKRGPTHANERCQIEFEGVRQGKRDWL